MKFVNFEPLRRDIHWIGETEIVRHDFPITTFVIEWDDDEKKEI